MHVKVMFNIFGFVFLQLLFIQIAIGAGAPNDPTIGGGKLYVEAGSNNKILTGDFTVRNISELKTALRDAVPNQVIFMPSDVEIDFTNEQASLLIPKGVTLASDRGTNGSKGALLYSASLSEISSFSAKSLLKVVSDDVRITGFRLRGPHSSIQNKFEYKGIESKDNNNLVIDNMELFNWSFAAVQLAGSSLNVQVHHSNIHHNQRSGLGYGVVIYGDSEVVIHHNIFDYNRHSIAGSGEPGQGYEAHSNIILAHSNGHSFDMHGYFEWAGPESSTIAGEFVNIHNNTFLLGTNAIVIRGIPTLGVFINDNKFANENESEMIRQSVLSESRVIPYQGTFIVKDNEFSLDRDMLYTDIELGSSALARIPNDIFWAVPQNIVDAAEGVTKNWYVSYNGIEPWKKLLSSGLPLNELRIKDFDGDGVADVFNATEEWEISGAGVNPWEYWNRSGSSMDSLLFADIDGNGMTDVIHKSWKFISWNGSSSWDNNNVLHSSVDFTDELFFVDIGNDQQVDIIRANGNAFEVSWGGQTTFEQIGNRSFTHSGFAHGDFDGDGRKDVFKISDNNWEVRYFGDTVFNRLSSDHVELLSDIALGDFNGDGKTDVFRKYNDQWQYSSGGVGDWVNLQRSDVELSNLAFGDFNGDGFTDVFYIDQDNNWNVSWSGLSSGVAINNSGIDFSRLVFADFNRDGSVDIANAKNGVVNVSVSGSQLWKVWSQMQ